MTRGTERNLQLEEERHKAEKDLAAMREFVAQGGPKRMRRKPCAFGLKEKKKQEQQPVSKRVNTGEKRGRRWTCDSR